MRYVSLEVYVIVGFLIGNTIADLIVAFAVPTWRSHLGRTCSSPLRGRGRLCCPDLVAAEETSGQSDVHGSARRTVRSAPPWAALTA